MKVYRCFRPFKVTKCPRSSIFMHFSLSLKYVCWGCFSSCPGIQPGSSAKRLEIAKHKDKLADRRVNRIYEYNWILYIYRHSDETPAFGWYLKAQNGSAGPLEKALEATVTCSTVFCRSEPEICLRLCQICTKFYERTTFINLQMQFWIECVQSSVMGVCFAPMLCVLFLSALDLSRLLCNKE